MIIFDQIFRTKDGKNYLLPFVLITSLFLLWGFAHALLDVLNKHFQDALHLTKAQSGAVQMSAYGAYFLMALPAGMIARRFGYKGGILVGLSFFAVGAFWFVPAVYINHFWAFLLGLLVLFAGLTCLETVANPYTTVLGPAETAASRINLAQTFNGLGWVLGPLVGSLLIFKNASGENPLVAFGGTLQKVFLGVQSEVGAAVSSLAEHASNSALIPPYVALGCVVLLVLLMFVFTKLPEVRAHTEHEVGEAANSEGVVDHVTPLYARPHFTLAVLAQFLYVAAQTGIGSFFVNYTVDVKSLAISDMQAGILLSLGGMALFVVGRLSGSIIMSRFSPGKLLGTFGLVNTLLMGFTCFRHDRFGIIALIASYFFMSIMFPSIFALGLRGLGEKTKTASSFLVMMVVGGAICPMLMGYIGDRFSMNVGFIVPLLCFAFISFYGYVGSGLGLKR
ncbi:MAG: L-fucose:H+ symporter permease [Verrucomicrobiales bacterium]|jgi:FHS family L-fucose permease-like MFS transporter|nr:L-fucose:H+ symporter permease [Verrucomicrobiales bacterium]